MAPVVCSHGLKIQIRCDIEEVKGRDFGYYNWIYTSQSTSK